MIKTCKHCGQDFDSNGTRAKYCPACRVKVRREHGRQHYQKNREHLLEVHREYYYRQKLKLIREILSAAKEALNREENL